MVGILEIKISSKQTLIKMALFPDTGSGAIFLFLFCAVPTQRHAEEDGVGDKSVPELIGV